MSVPLPMDFLRKFKERKKIYMVHILNAIPEIFSIYGILLITLSVAGGIAIGAMPGLSATMGVALFIPITFAMTPAHGLMALGGIYIGAIYGGSISAMFLLIICSPFLILIIFVRFPLTYNVEAYNALKIYISSSLFGGII